MNDIPMAPCKRSDGGKSKVGELRRRLVEARVMERGIVPTS